MCALARLDCCVGVPGEPGRFRQQLEVMRRECSFRVSDAQRLERLVPRMPAVRLAALLNAILDELTHAAPVGPEFFHHTAICRGARYFRLRSAAPLAGEVPAGTARLSRTLVWSRPKVEKDGQNSARLLSGGRNAQLVEDARHILLRGTQGDHQPVGDSLV